jgi:hypothetical protein
VAEEHRHAEAIGVVDESGCVSILATTT